MHFDLDRRASLEVYVPYLIFVVFTPLMSGNYLMNKYIITGMMRYYIALNLTVGISFLLTIVIITLMFMKYQQMDKDPSVEWLHSMGAIEYSNLTDTRLLYLQDIVFIDMKTKRKGLKVKLYTDLQELQFFYTHEGKINWIDFLDNYLKNFDIPVDLDGGNYYDTYKSKYVTRN